MTMNTTRMTYAEAILSGFRYLLTNHSDVFVFGQGLWSPWYVGTTMKDLDKEFGRDRIIDSPVSEVAVTGAATGASLYGYRPIVVHPRMDFMILAIDQIVTQAAKWSHMFGGQVHAPITIRAIINRGGEQGAQHSQALHSWFSHIPGLRVVMPATPADARDLFIASVLCDDPVLYIDDRWLYEVEQEMPPIVEKDLSQQRPRVVQEGGDCTLVASGYSVQLCLEAAAILKEDEGVSCEIIDMCVINPIVYDGAVASVQKTGRLCVVDGGWRNCGLAGEVIAGVLEKIDPFNLKARPVRLTLPDAPAPTSRVLEDAYYLKPSSIVSEIMKLIKCG